MNRFLITSFFALALIVGVTGAAPVAHAQLGGGGQNTFCDNSSNCSYTTQAAADAANTAMTATNAAAKSAANQTPTTPNPGSSNTAFNPVMSAIAGLFAWLVGVAALVLDWTVYYTVVNMGAYINKLTAIGVTWRILRDIGNIMLIFGFLAIGISVILNTERIGYGKKMLPMLLVAAVFLNFSLFFSEAIIDTGNLFATQFYTQINGGVTPTADTLKGITTANQGISSKLMSQLGLQSIYDVQKNSTLLDGATPWYIGFLAILLFIVTAFVMFSLAFILIARFIVLVFLIILAPIGFAGLAVPQLKHKAGQWWSALFQQTITAPVLLLLLYVALAVITDAQFLTGLGGGSAGAITGFVDNNNLGAFASYMMSFSIAIGLMLAVTISAKSLSAFGADKATALAGKLSFGATALGASTLLGGTSRLLRYGVQNKLPDNRYTRAASRVLRAGEGARMDLRAIPGVSTGLASAGVGGPVGKSAAGRAKQGAEWVKKTSQESDHEFDKETRMPKLRAAVAANDHATTARILGNMSDKELEESSVQRLLENPANSGAVAALTQSRFDKLLTSDVISDAQKANLRKQRDTGITARYTEAAVYQNPPTHPTAPGAVIPSVRRPGTNMSRGEQAVRALTNEAASQLPDATLLNPDVHENLSVRQLNAIFNAGKIQDTTATTVGTFLRGDPTFAAYFAGRNPQQQADLRAFWHI